ILPWRMSLNLIVPTTRALRRPHSQGRQPSRTAGHSIQQARTGHKSQDCQVTWTRNPGQATRPRRRGDRVNKLPDHRQRRLLRARRELSRNSPYARCPADIGLRIQTLKAATAREIDTAFESLVQARTGALLVSNWAVARGIARVASPLTRC